LKEEVEVYLKKQKNNDPSENEVNSLVCKIPDYTKYNITEAYLREHGRCFDLVEVELMEYTGEDMDEIHRITRIIWRLMSKEAIKLEDPALKKMAEKHLSFDDKEPSPEELLLSGALFSCLSSMQALRDGDIKDAFSLLTDSRGYLGNFIGRKDSNYQIAAIKKDMSKKAADIRHFENRAMKAQAIQYYQDNREMLGSKEKASYEISQKIVPVSSATIKGWLKNI
jgi:hypothetical protein